MLHLYGLSNCDSCREARRWLRTHRVDAEFHDLRRDGLDGARLAAWEQAVGWERLLNRRSATWRSLPAGVRNAIDRGLALSLLRDHPTLLKRPLLELPDGSVEVGFAAPRYAAALEAPP